MEIKYDDNDDKSPQWAGGEAQIGGLVNKVPQKLK